MLACDQNGVTGFLVYDIENIEINKSPVRDNVVNGWIAVFNRKGSESKNGDVNGE